MAKQMSPDRFQDRWEAFKGQEQQVCGVEQLYDAIKAVDGKGLILREDAPWALQFSEKPPAGPAPPTSTSTAPPAPSGGLDPRGQQTKPDPRPGPARADGPLVHRRGA